MPDVELTRRQFLQAMAAGGAVLAWPSVAPGDMSIVYVPDSTMPGQRRSIFCSGIKQEWLADDCGIARIVGPQDAQGLAGVTVLWSDTQDREFGYWIDRYTDHGLEPIIAPQQQFCRSVGPGMVCQSELTQFAMEPLGRYFIGLTNIPPIWLGQTDEPAFLGLIISYDGQN